MPEHRIESSEEWLAARRSCWPMRRNLPAVTTSSRASGGSCRVPDGQHHDFRFDQVGDLEQKCGCGAHVPCRSWKGK